MRTKSNTSSIANAVAGTARRRKRNNKTLSIRGTDQSQNIRYASLGVGLSSTAAGLVDGYYRAYIPGSASGLVSPSGPNICAFYSTGKFLPGTTVEWIPSVGFTTSGRVYVGFTDNPEVVANMAAQTGTTYGNMVKGLGNVISFPVYQHEKWNVPTKLRRKMFDCNEVWTATADTLDRCMQTTMFVYIDGAPASTALGGMRFEDNVAIEGIIGTST